MQGSLEKRLYKYIQLHALYMCSNTCIHAYNVLTHTYTHTYVHAYVHTYIHKCIYTCINGHIHTYICTHIHTAGSLLWNCLPVKIHVEILSGSSSSTSRLLFPGAFYCEWHYI